MTNREDFAALLALFNTPTDETNKRLKNKKETYLLKHNLFTTIYQKKGQQNFNEIVENITLNEYGFGFRVYD